MPDWMDLSLQELETFLLFTQLGSCAETARHLKVRDTEVKRRLERVAAGLGRELFISSRGETTRLNEYGRRLVVNLRPAMELLQSARDAVRRGVLIRVGYSQVARSLLVDAMK